MNNQQCLDDERYQANLSALNEFIACGCSEQSIYQFCFEAGIDRRDVGYIYEQFAQRVT